MGIGKTVTGALGSRAGAKLAPEYTAGFVRAVLDRAIDGVSRLPAAAKSADDALAKNSGDVDGAVHDLIENHVRMAGAQGFVTNLGGFVSMAVLIPTNIAGLALVQCHLVAGIAHLHGYDLADHRVRNAILVCMLGEDTVDALVRKKKLPSSPMALATAPGHDEKVDRLISKTVTAELIAKVGGKHVVTMVGRRVPLMGGAIGATADGFNTWRIGRYADRSLPQRRRR